jgi:hypothetical protein
VFKPKFKPFSLDNPVQNTAPATPNHRYRIKEDMQESPQK